VFGLHGLPGTRRDFARFAGTLAERGLCTVAFDVPGFRASPAAPQPGWQHIPEALADAITALSTGPATLLAHSFGAHLAVYSAALAPSVRALALLAPAGLRPHRAVRQLGPAPWLRAVAASGAGRALFHTLLTRSPLGRNTPRAGSELVLALLASADFARSGSTFRALDLPVLLARWPSRR
jgi:pimeloyl-ACP methyl ester carboxylesterase